MVRVTALDIQVSLCNPNGHVGGQHDVSENALPSVPPPKYDTFSINITSKIVN